jgi:hypothetical protein
MTLLLIPFEPAAPSVRSRVTPAELSLKLREYLPPELLD